MKHRLLVTALLLATSTASAYTGQVTASVKAGPYVPGIDQEMAGGQRVFPIYRCFFETKSMPLGIAPMLGVDLDMHLFDFFGSVQLGLGVSVAQARGKALPVGATRSVNVCDNDAGDAVELSIGMVRPSLTYRLDPLLDWFGFPLVPYARIGVLAAGYAFTRNGSWDDAGEPANQNPLGVRFGYEAAVGLMLALDFVDLRQLWSLIANRTWPPPHRSTILDHAYFFAEIQAQQIDNFGQPGLILTPEDRVFGSGLPFMVNVGIAMELL